MSTTIDERVVSMQFDNRQFESNVQTSLGTLDKLKQSLNLTGAAKGLEDINSTARKFDMSMMGGAVETVRAKFSALEVMAVTALANITNSAVNTGKRIVSAFTIEPIKTGLQEYETQINAVQTILANTEHKGTTLDQVNSALDELNTYADKTIYNFTQMTRNIGTFTAAGVDLDKSVTSIKGIANLAAVSGSTSQQASTAMYQLSQALAAGKVSLMDWNSVVNAGMGGQVFQNALKRTATQMGTNVDALIKKYGSFRESLTQGQWLTAEVLTETLTQLSGAYTKSDLIAKGYSEAQADEILKLAETAENAATKVKTFTQLMDTLKESAQSGWTQTWELLVGDFEQAKTLWTGVSDAIGGFINKTSESRNKLLEGALTSNWDKLIKRINDAGIQTADFEERVGKVAKKHGIDLDKTIEKYGSLEKAFRSGAISSDVLKEAVAKTSETIQKADLSLVDKVVKQGSKGEAVKQVENALKALGYDLKGKDGKEYGSDGYFGTVTRDAVKEFQKLKGLEVTGIVDEKTLKALKEATSESKELGTNIDDLIGGLDELGGREMLIESFKNIFKGLLSVLKPIGTAFRQVFPPMTSEQLYNMIKGFKDLTSKFKLSMPQIRKIHQTFKGLFSVIDIGWTFVKDLAGGIFSLLGNFTGLFDVVLNVTSTFGNWLTSLRDSAKETDIFGKAIDGIVGFIQSGIDKIKEFYTYLSGKLKAPGFEGFFSLMKGIWNIVQQVGTKIVGVGTSIGKALGSVLNFENLSGLMSLANGGIFGAILLGVKNFIDGFGDTFDGANGILGSVKDILDGVKGSLEAWQTSLKADTLGKIAKAIAILAAAILILATIEPEKLNASLGAVTMLFVDLMGSLAIFNMMGGKFGKAASAVTLMNGMATAVLILASSLRMIAGLEPKDLITGLVGIIVLTIAAVGAAKALATDGKKAMKGATGLIALAIGVKILASACKDLSSMSVEELAKGLIGVVVIMAAISGFSVLAGKAQHIISTGVAMILMGAAMKIFASAVKDFGSINTDELGRGLLAVAASLLAIVIAVNLMPSGGSMFGIGVGLVIVGAALMIVAEAIKKLGALSWDEVKVGLIAIGGSLAILAIGLNFMRGTLAASAALVVAAVALAVIAPVLKTLGSMDIMSIGKGLLAIAGAFIVIGVAGLVLGPLVPVILALAGALALTGVAIALFGVGVFALAAGIGALAGVTAAGATAIVAALTIIVTGVASLIPTVIRSLGDGIVQFFQVIGESATAIGGAVTAVVLACVDALVACVPQLADGLLKIITGVLSALVTYTPTIVESIFQFLISVLDGITAKLPELLVAVVNVFMAFFSGIVQALQGIDVSTLINGLAGVGIMAGIMAILGAVSALVPGAMTGVLGMAGVVAEIALMLAAVGAFAQIPGLEWLISEGGTFLQNIGNAIGGFVGGLIGGVAEGITASLPQIGTDLSTFMTNLTPFLDGAKLVDATMLTGVQTIVSIITSLTAASLLEGLTSWITGGSSLTTFASELPLFGEGIKSFADKVAGINTESVTAAVTAAKSLAEIADIIPNEGGLISLFTGENNLATFATQLPAFGEGIKGFADKVSGINSESVTAAVTAATSLAGVADIIPNQGGLLALFTGDNSMATFATQLPLFGDGIKGFADKVSGIKTEAVTTAVTAASGLVDMANKLPESGGLFSIFTGDNSMETFGKEIKKFGEGLAGFAEKVSGIDTITATTATSIATRMSNMANKIPEGGYSILSTFGGQLQGFGVSLSGFITEISDINTEGVSVAMTNINDLVTNLNSIDTSGVSGLSKFGDTMGKLGKEGVDDFVKAFSSAEEAVSKAINSLIENIVSAVKAKKSTVKKAFGDMMTEAVDKIRSQRSSFYSAGEYIAYGLIEGIKSKLSEAYDAGASLANSAKKGAEEASDTNSPSRVFMTLGEYLGEGYIIGMEHYASKSYKMGAELANSAKNGLSRAISNVSSLIENGIDSQPTIRPVLDLSDITSGVSTMNGMFGVNPSISALDNVGSISSAMNRRNQNGANYDVVSAIKDLGRKMGSASGDTYNINGVTYDDGSTVSNAIKALTRAIVVEGRV